MELEGRVVAEDGDTLGRPEVVPISWQGEDIGRLLVDGGLDRADRVLLATLVAQAAPALRTVALTAELAASRERLVLAREEERRRLRDDLHDGLGSHLAGLSMGLDALGTLVDEDPDGAREVIARLRSRSHEAVDTVRTVVRGLRPPALDELGLRGALEERAMQLAADAGLELHCEFEASDGLPAATEVAAYHVAVEALTNVVRHASAGRVWLRLVREERQVVVEVADDGAGIDPARPAGVGLRSMRERAAELGGDLAVEVRPGGGTAVRATLPVRA